MIVLRWKPKITSFEIIRPNSDADVCKEACPSLLEWANYLLEPYADIESKDDSKVNSDINQKGPMLSYKITDDEIKWKKEPATETKQANASTPIIGEEWCKYDFDVEKKTKAALMCNIANALKVCHSKYEKLKKLNNQQKHDHESIQLGMWLVMQMHCNDTGTTNDKHFQETLEIIRMKHLEDMKSNKVKVENEISNIPPEQATETATVDANSKNDSGDGDIESDDDNEIVLHNKNYQKSSIFDDDDDDNDSEQ